MAQCLSNKHFDLIVFSEKEIELKEGTNYKQGIIKSGLIGAEYFAFEIQKKASEFPENKFDTYDYIFPSEVKVYKLFKDGWYLINKKNIETFEQLGRLKLNSVYEN